MTRVRALLGVAVWITGCATAPSQFEVLTKKPTPLAWRDPGVFQFHLSDVKRSWLGSITLRFTGTKTETCSGGDWRLAEVIESTAKLFPMGGPAFVVMSTPKVAYEISGAFLSIDLNGGICDSNNMMQGELFESGAAGRIDSVTMFGGPQLGWFTAAPVKVAGAT